MLLCLSLWISWVLAVGDVEKTVHMMINIREMLIADHSAVIARQIEKYRDNPMVMHQANQVYVEKIKVWEQEVALLRGVLDSAGVNG